MKYRLLISFIFLLYLLSLLVIASNLITHLSYSCLLVKGQVTDNNLLSPMITFLQFGSIGCGEETCSMIYCQRLSVQLPIPFIRYNNFKMPDMSKKVFVIVLLVMALIVTIVGYISSVSVNNMLENSQFFYNYFKITPTDNLTCAESCKDPYSIQKLTQCCDGESTCMQKSQCISQKLAQYEQEISDLTDSITYFNTIWEIGISVTIIILIFIFAYIHKKRIDRIRRLRNNNAGLLYENLLNLIEEAAERNNQKQQLMESIKRKIQSEQFIFDGEDENCAICLSSFYHNKVLQFQCSHIFHTECALAWVERKVNCPLCRTTIQL